jgi:hypothetical protein
MADGFVEKGMLLAGEIKLKADFNEADIMD